MGPVILLVNHREKNCGVHQYGERVFFPLLKSENYQCYYIDIDRELEFDYWAGELKPQLVVYNYYSQATMPWLTAHKINKNRGRFKQLSIFHEVDNWHMGFDGMIHQDPSNDDTRFFNIARPIPDYRPVVADPEIPTFGSFGFGLGGKGFTRLIEYVIREFDTAHIKLNIPFAKFGDANGAAAGNWARSCDALVKDHPNITLKITHDLLPEKDLIDWLAANTMNCFLYDEHYGRGISGTLDYALAAGKPIAITKSWQFKHFWGLDQRCLVENGGLKAVLAHGSQFLDLYRNKWGNTALVADFEAIFRHFGV